MLLIFLKYSGAQVLYYRRHADGIICCFQNSHDADMFFQYLNKCHPNIKFRMETETDGKLHFLDVLLSKQRSTNNECPCITSVFSKKRLILVYVQMIQFYFFSGVCKTRNPPRNCRNLPEPPGTQPEPPETHPQPPGTTRNLDRKSK